MMHSPMQTILPISPPGSESDDKADAPTEHKDFFN